ncbi:GntR family transcriptional regulator [Paludibacterium yongneupense]|uniref:GntR family transcriptional regulator n=1 Tax=Paludibacterium yongneupense TaxID=400061 RepID=UPI00040D5FCE|nr:GntR family transcriptional regulator [Paludibacterium yongneupense]
MTFKAKESLTEQIAHYLEQRIIMGEMEPGERIQELRIAAEMDVSRGSVRESLLILQRRHLVEIFPRRGAIVSSISGSDVRDFFELWLLLIERAAVDLAASWKGEDLAPLFEDMQGLSDCLHNDDLPGFYRYGIAFMNNIGNGSGNRYLRATLQDLAPLTQRCFYAILRAGRSQIDRGHHFMEALLQALIARDAEQVRVIASEFGSDYTRLAQASADALAGRKT